MKYKVGDKVRIKSLEWYEANKDEQGKILCIAPSGRKCYFSPELSSLCGKEVVIKDIFNQLDAGFYFIQGFEGYAMTDDMFEEIKTSTDNEPQFTLSPEEVEDLRFILDKRNSRLDFMLEKAFEDTPINRERIKEQKKLLPILNRINQWQNEKYNQDK